jgi:hypothetical protein
MQDVTAIGKPATSAFNITAPTHASVLKKLQLKGDVKLVVQILEQSQDKVRPHPGVFRIWAQRLVNPDTHDEVCSTTVCF